MELIKRVQAFIRERELLQPGQAVVAGVSGGPDSLCLLDILHRLAPDWGLSLHVAHLNHGLRPGAAEAEAERVRAEAGKRGLPFHTELADTRAYAQAHKLSIEEAARHVRYSFLARVAQTVEARAIAVAHTADDQAETVLMHFLRGAGLAGLRGMQAKTVIGNWGLMSNYRLPITLIRPLLATTRAEVEVYCAEHSLNPVQDATNFDTTLFRNRLRHELLPILETYNPQIRAILGRTAEVLAGECELAQRVADQAWADLAQVKPSEVSFDRPGWLAASLPEQRALLRKAVQQLRSDLRDVDFVPLEQAVQFSRTAAPGRQCDVLGGLRLSITPDRIVLSPWAFTPAPPADVPMIADGKLAHGWGFETEALTAEQWSLADVETNSNDWRAYVDADRLREPLTLRVRAAGDWFQPLGLSGGRTKLSDFFINQKIDVTQRDRWPLVVSGADIVWVAGLRLDERFKVTPETRRVLRLAFIKTD
jgi:tRNA(Ile)-lysidine synthase